MHKADSKEMAQERREKPDSVSLGNPRDQVEGHTPGRPVVTGRRLRTPCCGSVVFVSMNGEE